MTDSLKLAEMQRTSIEFERQRHLANWFIKSSPHMATPSTPLSTNGGVSSPTSGAGSNSTNNTSATQSGNGGTKNGSTGGAGGGGTITTTNPLFFLMSNGNGNTAALGGTSGNPNASNAHPNGIPVGKHSSGGGGGGANGSGGNGADISVSSSRAHPAMGAGAVAGLGHHVEGRKPKLRRFNSHDTGANMFSVADFENARLARRNEIEMKQRLQRRMKISSLGTNAYGSGGCGSGSASGGGMGSSGAANNYGSGSLGGDCSTGDSKGSKHSNDSQTEPLAAEIFLDRYTLPRVVRISYKTKFSHETLQSSSSNGSTSTSTQSSSGTGGGMGSGTGTSSTTSSSGNINTSNTSNNSNNNNNNHNNNTSNVGQQLNNGSSNSNTKNGGTTTSGIEQQQQQQHQQSGELFLLYRLIRQRHIYHGFNAKTGMANRKKGVMIPQEFPGYFSLLNDKGLPTATLYTSLIQLVRERVYKFVSVDNMPAFTESQPNPVNAPLNEGCLPGYHGGSAAPPPPPAPNSRPQYVKTTARGGQVFRLLAVFEDGKQDHSNHALSNKPNSSHGREKEKGRYAQLLNENRQVIYVSLSTKGKFYEIEPGIPQILQKLGGNSGGDQHKKVNPDCVHRITALVTPHKQLPLTLRFISGPTGTANSIPENLSIVKISTENVVIACPIEDVEVQSPLHLRKLHLTAEMNLVKCALGFENEQRMFANPNVQNILKFCQFNCDQFLKMIEVEVLNRPERSGSKSRGDGLRILKPLHLPKLLRREKTTISAHEKEDSIIFLSKHDLANLEAKEDATRQSLENSGSTSRISDKMKVFQTTKKKWFRRQDKHAVTSLTSLELDVQAKRMSMERYNDMSKLLQERFGDKRANGNADESVSERSASEIGCSDTETTTLHTIEEKLKKFSKSNLLQKSMSLQDVELIGGCGGKPDLLSSHNADTISEAGTDLEDMENRPPSLEQQQSFITEKLYTEFHVKTRQYSKSSSSLHQLLHFAVPQKLQMHENKRSLAQLKQQQQVARVNGPEKHRIDFNIGEPVTGRRAAGGLSLLAAAANGTGGGSISTSGNSQNTSLISPLTPTSLLEDDLPYSSVRDSLVLSSDESGAEHPAGQICQPLHLIDYTKENIYAEICHDAVAMGGIPSSQTRETFSSNTHSTDVGDDYGDYASLTHPYMSVGSALNGATNLGSTAGQAISRVQINCSSSPVSYHTVFLGDEPLGEHYAASKRAQLRNARGSTGIALNDMTNVTTVECSVSSAQGEAKDDGGVALETTARIHHNNNNNNHGVGTLNGEEAVDNIYNTLK